jgi:hypothetical protein
LGIASLISRRVRTANGEGRSGSSEAFAVMGSFAGAADAEAGSPET